LSAQHRNPLENGQFNEISLPLERNKRMTTVKQIKSVVGVSLKAISIKLLASAVLLLLNACSQAEVEPCGEGVPRHSLHAYTNRTCPIAGPMGAYRLAIPRQYQFAEVAYKGFDIWK
jgi:hypothetical protein